MLKRDFNKVAKQLYWNRTSVWVFPVNLQHIFRTPFLKNTSDELLFYILVFVLTLLDLRVLKVFFHITGKSHSNFQTFEEVKDSFSYQCSHLFQCFPVFRRSLSTTPENLWFSDVFRGIEMEPQNNEKHWNKQEHWHEKSKRVSSLGCYWKGFECKRSNNFVKQMLSWLFRFTLLSKTFCNASERLCRHYKWRGKATAIFNANEANGWEIGEHYYNLRLSIQEWTK